MRPQNRASSDTDDANNEMLENDAPKEGQDKREDVTQITLRSSPKRPEGHSKSVVS